MAEDKNAESGEEKSKPPLLPILIAVLVSIVVSIGAVFATLFMTGFFDEESELEAELARIEAEEPVVDVEEEAEPTLMETPNPSRLDTLYYEISRPLTANVSGSRKVMQITVAVMTHYDESVVANITKHELSLRSAMLSVLTGTTEEDLADPAFKDSLAEDLRIAINAELEEYEDFGGVERVLFSEFLVQ
ncbi:MAG: flagellar basal body-associated protein FliL [Pseudomonadales bacterium]|jgi:flagellar FliL protein